MTWGHKCDYPACTEIAEGSEPHPGMCKHHQRVMTNGAFAEHGLDGHECTYCGWECLGHSSLDNPSFGTAEY